MSGKPLRPRGEDPEAILCRLCDRPLRSITWTHLVMTHGWSQEGAVTQYKTRFRVDSSKCRDLRDIVRRNVRRYFEQVGRRWTKARIRREIRGRAKRGLPLNHGAAQESAKGLENAALRLYGSWDVALRASGISVPEIRQLRAWTADSLVRCIQALRQAGAELNSKSVERIDGGLRQTACRVFGSWDAALLASGIDPLSVRKSRVWTPAEVLAAIRSRPPLRSGEAFRRDRKLWVAASKLFSSWDAAVKAARERTEGAQQ